MKCANCKLASKFDTPNILGGFTVVLCTAPQDLGLPAVVVDPFVYRECCEEKEGEIEPG